VQGDNKALNDIAYSPQVGDEIVRRFGADTKQKLETVVGWRFTAGLDD
jgi:hypothetical protein